jgi:hypothetical protein
MTRDDYNKKVQAIQEVWPGECRVKPLYDRFDRLVEARFEVFFDKWRTLGVQHLPFQATATYVWDDREEAMVMYHLAGGVTSDRIGTARS